MLYRRPFSVILEEAVEGGEVVATEPLEEGELVQAVEESAELEAEIAQDTGDVEEAIEEAEALSEQAAATDEVLAQTADETGVDEASAITEEQVVTAEESFKWSLAKLGVASGYSKVVATAQESAGTKSRRERLKVCNEGVKEFLGKLIASIINLAKQIASRIVLFVKKNIAIFANYKKQIEKIEEKFKNIDVKDVDGRQLAKEIFSRQNMVTFDIIDENNAAAFASGDNPMGDFVAARALVKKISDDVIAAAKTKDESKLEATEKSIDSFRSVAISKYVDLESVSKGLTNRCAQEIASAGGSTNIIGLDTNAFLVSNNGKVVKVSLEYASDFVDKVSVDVNKITASVTSKAANVKKAAENIKAAADAVVNVQKEVEKELKKVEANIKVEGFNVAKGIGGIKSIGISVTMGSFNLYLAGIKEYIRAANIIAKLAGKKEEEKKEESK